VLGTPDSPSKVGEDVTPLGTLEPVGLYVE